jgi:hypothetical protein
MPGWQPRGDRLDGRCSSRRTDDGIARGERIGCPALGERSDGSRSCRWSGDGITRGDRIRWPALG